MADKKCKVCGTLNAADARFCRNCDEFFPDATASTTPQPGPPDDQENNRAAAPQTELATTEATVEPGSGGSVELRVRNNSTIVDAYGVQAVSPPEWLTLEHPEISLTPGENTSAKITFAIRDHSFVEAQTIKVPLRICSMRDATKFAQQQVSLTIPPYGPKVSLTARPTIVAVEDDTSGKFQVLIDNKGSNHSRRLVLTGSDPEDAVRFDFPENTVEVRAGKSTTIDVRFDVPALDEGERRTRQLKVTATEGGDTSDVTVTVNQEQSTTLPLKLRLEPGKLRVEDCPIADLTLVIDNRDGKRDRTLRLEGRDTENAMRFAFAAQEVFVGAGKTTPLRFSVQAKQPPPGQEVAREFTVVAAEGTRESEISGTLVQATSEPPIKTASLRLSPDTLRQRDRTHGTYQVALQNTDTSQWLQAGLFAWDQERAMRFALSPERFDLSPGEVGTAWLSVAAPRPARGKEQSRTFQVEASDGRESVTATGTFIQTASNWIPIVRNVLILLGGIAVVAGTLTPWMINLPDYYITALPKIGQATDIVEKTQPAVRTAILLVAIAMMIGVVGKGGKTAVTSAVLIATTLIGYFVYLTSQVGTGGPMYGAYLVGGGALLGFVGGLLARL